MQMCAEAGITNLSLARCSDRSVQWGIWRLRRQNGGGSGQWQKYKLL